MAYKNSYFISCQEQYGHTPLDRVEKLCRENRIFTYSDFMIVVFDVDGDLARWVTSKNNMLAKKRGIMARISKVKREFKESGGVIARV